MRLQDNGDIVGFRAIPPPATPMALYPHWERLSMPVGMLTLRPLDRWRSIDGTSTADIDDIHRLLTRHVIGRRLALNLLRNKALLETEIEPA